ncbi:16S rRNA (cytidine(1402)-2'-O)-methyltransferase [Acholeplasma equifetale]|uniref:16S rRNA (cytidine(1402)-2'-O)-methyltransferase n=1 Tax=Acholeplasma equifetale TaxID=264634 RepID=UPI00068BDD15|nr:16S rRNA (cytidine(1402)-2'-O)-methyltransferase [Acholeplasma equifetale]
MNIQTFDETKSTLYIVSTPIGNLKDITLRALDVLKEVDLVLAEDTRVSLKLLNHYDIHKPLLSYEKFNEKERVDTIISRLKENQNIALISDAGTPLLSDPGSILVNKVIDEGFNVVAVPGASALLTGLVITGIRTEPFTFLGFLPRKQSEAKKILINYYNRIETLVIYESPLRINDTLNLLYETLGNRYLVLTRELTKKFETTYRGELKDIKDEIFDTRGEYVIYVEGKLEEIIVSDDIILKKMDEYIKKGLLEKDAMKMVAKDLNISKKEVYQVIKIK